MLSSDAGTAAFSMAACNEPNVRLRLLQPVLVCMHSAAGPAHLSEQAGVSTEASRTHPLALAKALLTLASANTVWLID